jgi:acetyl/propionyl-CoA carboxylase alpha subunit
MDSMLQPLKQVGKEYKTLIAKMTTNSANVESAKANLLNLCDIDMILGLPCILPMLESMNGLMKFVQGKDIFVCDYIIAVKICQGDLYKMYNDFNISFQLESFPKFTDMVTNTSCRIAQDWVINLNDGTKQLNFHTMGIVPFGSLC